MARVIIELEGKGLREAGVQKLVDKLKTEYGEDVAVHVHKKNRPESRQERFAEATGLIEEGKAEVESLRDELQEWKDGMPENLQNGSKAEEIDEAITQLEEVIDKAEEISGTEVNFPAMR